MNARNSAYRFLTPSGEGADGLFKLAVVAILLASAAYHLIFVFSSGNVPGVYNLRIDTPTYKEIARAVIQNGLAGIPLSQPPGFVLYLAGLERIAANPVMTAKVANVFFHLLISMLSFFIAFRYIGKAESLIALALTAGSPMLQAFSATLQYEVLSALINTGVLVSVLLARTQDRNSLSILAGVFTALGSLVREVTVVLIPVFFLYLLLRRRRLALYYLAASLIPIGIWILIQHGQHDAWVFISDKGTVNLELGYNPNATGTYHAVMAPVIEPKGVRFIKENPGKAFQLAWQKFLYFAGFEGDGWNIPRYFSVLLNRTFLGLLDYSWSVALARSLISVLALLGAVILLRDTRLRETLFCLPAVLCVTLLVYVVFISSARFMLPILPIVMLMAAICLGQLRSTLLSRPYLTAVVVVFFIAAQFFSVPFHYRLEAEETDGTHVENLSCEECSGHAARRVLPGTERQRAILTHDQYYPSGRYRILLHLAQPVTETAKFSLVGYNWRRQRVFTRSFHSDSPTELSTGFDLTETLSLAFAVTIQTSGEALIDSLMIESIP